MTFTTAMTATTATTRATDNRPGPIPFHRLLHVEWRKSLDTRAARWLLAAVALVTIGAVAIPTAMPDQTDQSLESYLSFGGLGLCLLLPAVSILMLTTEWTQRTVLVTFTQEPRRSRVLAAKIASGLMLGLAGAVYAALVAATGLAVSAALGRTVTWDTDTSHATGLVMFVLLNSLMGMAFGALLHKSAAAIVLYYVLPTIWTLIAIGALKRVREWLDTVQTFGWVLTADWDGHLGQILTSTTTWVVAPLLVGLLRTVRREVA
jgi:ABC-2 type transport system permease protein